MQIDFQCQKCEESFSLELSDLSNDSALLRCPGCGTRASDEQVENVVAALEELFAAVAPLRRKFTSVVEVNSEELPPPYDEQPVLGRKAALLDEDDSEDGGEEDEGELDEDAEEREREA
jgi:uncharacterized Zn finger protein